MQYQGSLEGLFGCQASTMKVVLNIASHKRCFTRRETIAEELGLALSTVKKAIQLLQRTAFDCDPLLSMFSIPRPDGRRGVVYEKTLVGAERLYQEAVKLPYKERPPWIAAQKNRIHKYQEPPEDLPFEGPLQRPLNEKDTVCGATAGCHSGAAPEAPTSHGTQYSADKGKGNGEEAPFHDRMRTCCRCYKLKPATREYFHQDRRDKKLGLRRQCKVCWNAYQRRKARERRNARKADM